MFVFHVYQQFVCTTFDKGFVGRNGVEFFYKIKRETYQILKMFLFAAVKSSVEMHTITFYTITLVLCTPLHVLVLDPL